MAIDETVHRISTEEYTRMVESGALEDMRVELLDGLLVDVSPQGHPHSETIHRLMVLFAARVDLLHVRMPLEMADGWVPEPDVALATRPGGRHPSTAHLVVEVAATRFPVALQKAVVYARAGVTRYWIVEIDGARVLEYTEPGPEGYTVTNGPDGR